MQVSIYPKLLATSLLLMSQVLLLAQKKVRTPAAAEKEYKSKDYYEAADIYKAVFSAKDLKLSGSKLAMHQFYYAESCRRSYNYARAQEYYGLVATGEYADKYPEIDYYYAYCLKHNGKYEEAIKYFKEFLAMEVKGIELTYLQLEADHELKGCYLALELVENPDRTSKIIHLSGDVNTKYSDFSPHLVGETLYYSSLRFERELTRGKVVGKGQTLVGKIMTADNRGQSRFEQSKNKNLNLKYENSGNSNLNSDGTKLYLTKCDYDERKEKMICQIYYCPKKGKNDWGEAVKLPENINVEGVTCTHPAIGFDSVRNKEVLYFVSERKGGVGKKDIWMAEVLGENEYGEARNLGENINTIGDEVSPFFHNTTQSLYFSSSHRPGLGGFDVFHANIIDGEFDEPINIGIPLNSAANDIYFIINPDDSTGYFASNRPGSQILTGESCCNDIYELKLPEFPPVRPKPEPEPPLVLSDPTPEPEPVSIVEPEPIPTPVPTPEPVETVIEETVQVTLDELNKLLPLALYFHNNEPRDLETSYSSTYTKYAGMRSKYKKEHVPQYNKSIQEQIADNIDDFFDNKVQGNYKKMHLFFDELITAMENDFKLEIAIQGYTSPRASAAYNKALANRRIVSVMKDMLAYKEGVLKKYLDNGQLSLKELPLGEGKAPAGISDDIDDPRNSIYSVEAASQRRVNFIVVELQQE
ncbi:PD40 domain-containing protein [Aureispira sp. CCB-QB1]|uniref:PD40 domain-containing protein n=1 Tax=Aureispira sp. CCB-QB1 TaxID=1313421 RepID=UPI000697A3D4|nr:PD40 domain-containing protein [Aureispira sp. CCB-QB1]